MTITLTVDIPADRIITLEVPPQIPAGEKAIITFTPVTDTADRLSGDESAAEDCPICAKNRDPETGELRFNAETVAAIEEGRAMMRGAIPAKRFSSLDEMWEDLMSDDEDESSEDI